MRCQLLFDWLLLFKMCTCDCFATLKSTSYFGLLILFTGRFLLNACYILEIFKFTFSVHDLPFLYACQCMFVSWFSLVFIQSICTILHDVCRAFHQHFECFSLSSFALSSVQIFTIGENFVAVDKISFFFCLRGGFHWRFYCRGGW